MKTFTRETLKEFNFVSSPLFSPQGRYLAYRQASTDGDKNNYITRIHIYDTTSGISFPLTTTDIGEGMRFWNETTLIFVANRDASHSSGDFNAETKLYRISLTGGEAELWLTLDCEVEDFYPLNEDELLLLVSETEAARAKAAEAADSKSDSKSDSKASAEEKAVGDYEVLEESPFWFNGKGYTGGHRSRLYRYRISTKTRTALSAENVSASIFDFDKEKACLLYGTEHNDGVLDLYTRLFVYDLTTDQAREIVLNKAQQFSQATFAGDDVIFVAASMEAYGLNEDGFAYILKKDAESPELLSRSLFVGSSVGTDVLLGGGREFQGVAAGVYFCATEGSSSYLKFMDKNGLQNRVSDVAGAVNGIAVHEAADAGARIFICAMRGQGAQELYRVEGEREEQITFANKWLEDYQLSPIERFDFNLGEDQLYGFVIKPCDYIPGKKYPGLLTIHGGPKTVFGEILHHEMQLLAAKGYFVFYTNPRGSDGFGRDWADIRGKYGSVDYDQLMAFTDEVLERYPDIDANKLGVLGGSYGGFMTNWIIGHTRRFRAACSERSISNWFSMYGISDIGFYFTLDQTGFDPWSNHEKLWEQSPLKYADQMQTPTLIIHSDADYRCPLAEGQQLFTALKIHKVPTRMVVFKGENHELSRSGKPFHRQRRLRELEDWFEKYLQQA